jgi:hypothetical protein
MDAPPNAAGLALSRALVMQGSAQHARGDGRTRCGVGRVAVAHVTPTRTRRSMRTNSGSIPRVELGAAGGRRLLWAGSQALAATVRSAVVRVLGAAPTWRAAARLRRATRRAGEAEERRVAWWRSR